MSYVNAPATRLVATCCAVCSRPLVDATSVETGMGPTCRRKHGYGEIEGADDDRRQAANVIVHHIALAQSGFADLGDNTTFAAYVANGVGALQALGFASLANAIAKNAVAIRIVPLGGALLAVFTPYRHDIGQEFRRVPGRRWDKEAKCNTIPDTVESKRALLALLKDCFAGETGVGPKGAFAL